MTGALSIDDTVVAEELTRPPLHGAALAVTALALALGTFMQVLDATIANVSLPTIAGNIGASTDQATWIITSFVVANGNNSSGDGMHASSSRNSMSVASF